MKKIKLFFALFAMLALNVGNAWAQTVTWEKATSIAAGDVVALVCESKTMELSGISTTNTKYGIGTAYTSTPAGLYELTVEEGSTTGTFSLKNGSNYLYWTSGNSLNKTTTKDAKASWTITFSDGNAIIKNANTPARQLQWNAGSPRFACYDNSGQTPVQLYKKVISEESEDVIVKTLKSIEVSGMTTTYEQGDLFSFDGTCTATYSVTKNEVAQDDETKTVTPTVSIPDMNQVGEETITVSYTDGDETATTTYTINITENVVTPGTYTGNLNNAFFGCATGNNATEQSGKFNDVLVVAGCKSSASTKTNYQSGHVRFYADSYLTLSVPVGYVIKSIVFTADGTWNGSITASAGTYDNNSKTWTGNAQEVKFSFAQQNRIKSVKVTYAADVKYALNITTPSNGTLVVKEGETEVTSGATFPEGTKLSVVADPAQGYKLDGVTVVGESSNDVTDDVYADGVLTMPAYNITISAAFSVNEKPDATLTLSKNGVAETFPGSWKQDDVVTLPSITSDCVKEFVGWSADANCNVAPEYKAGDEYTLAATAQTLYAVYAIIEGGGSFTITKTMSEIVSENGYTISSGNTATCYTTLTLDENITLSTTGSANCGSFWSDPQEWRLYQNKSGNAIVTATNGCSLTSVKFTFTNSNTGTLLNNGAAMTSGTAVSASGTSATYVVGNSGTATNGQIRITQIEVVYTGGVTYSNYSTTCAAALASPTFSLAEGKYTEAKSVVINYTEGTVYYTLDGTTPTASSTQYTGAIALNDCGEYTIKAIAISSDSQSDVVSATYTIKLPLTNSQAAPYTEAEAIAVYDGGCYDNQDVYVKGTVKTATFNSTYGNYTITLTNGFQFYRFLQAAETKFTEDIIVPGDVLVACGKLSKFQTTYQLAEGCYLVERIPYEGEKTDISNTEATAYTVDKAFELIADVKSDLTKEVYVKGLVAVAPTSNPTADGQMTYKISDNGENTGNVLTVYLGLNLNGEKFTSKNDVQQGDYVVVKGKLLDYNSTYELNKGNQLVQHVKAATITIADITMEVGETKTIAATITPVAAETAVIYTIKENTDNAISLSGNTITADAVGTATITATIATAAEYMGKTVEFTVTVTPESTSDEVVILAELDGKWYAMKGAVPSGKSNQLDAVEVTYFNGTLYNVPDEVKASITWTRSVVDGKATFVNNGKYLKGGTSTDLTLVGTVDNNCKWMWNDENGYYTTNTSGTIRTFLYRNGYNFKNYGVSQAGKEDANGNYSELPVVTAPVYETGDVTYTRATTTGKFGTICLPFGSTNYTGAEFFEFVGSETGKVYIGSVDELVAGVPYIFLASAAKVVVTSDGTTAATPGNSNGLYGTFTDNTEVAVGNYILKDNALCQAETTCYVNAYRAYIVWGELPTGAPQQMPGRRYIGMSVQGENGETGFENITAPAGKTVKAIVNGQLIIIRDGEMYNAQGVRL